MGAAIAAGNQAENGIWALLVQAAIIMIKTHNSFVIPKTLSKLVYDHWPKENINPIQIKIPISPSRLVIAVIIPAL